MGAPLVYLCALPRPSFGPLMMGEEVPVHVRQLGADSLGHAVGPAQSQFRLVRTHFRCLVALA